jgi:hypothetical protein
MQPGDEEATAQRSFDGDISNAVGGPLTANCMKFISLGILIEKGLLYDYFITVYGPNRTKFR